MSFGMIMLNQKMYKDQMCYIRYMDTHRFIIYMKKRQKTVCSCYFTYQSRPDLVCKKEEIQFNDIIKQYKDLR